MYWVIALAIVIFSVLTVTTRKILRSATYLLFVLFATAALYFKLDYEFLGAVQIADLRRRHSGVVRVLYSADFTSGRQHSASGVEEARAGLVAGIATLVVAGWALLRPLRRKWHPSARSWTIRPCTVSAKTLMGTGKGRISASFRGCQRPASGMYNRWRHSRPQR